MPTADIARAFLVSEQAMGARLTRAKRKISAVRIPVRVPGAAELPDRLQTVLGVIHLLFTMGHTAPSGESLMRPGLVDRALHLTRMLRELMPDEREIRGLLALLLVTDARRATRAGANGRLLQLAEQDRSQWDRSAIAEAHDLIVDGLRGGRPGRYVLQAAIASLHAEAPAYDETDWPQIVCLYDTLLSVWPSSVVALNRAVVVSMVSGPQEALAEVERLEKDGRLAGYHYLPAIKADLLRRLGRPAARDPLHEHLSQPGPFYLSTTSPSVSLEDVHEPPFGIEQACGRSCDRNTDGGIIVTTSACGGSSFDLVRHVNRRHFAASRCVWRSARPASRRAPMRTLARRCT